MAVESAPWVWRQHHNGSLTFRPQIKERRLYFPWTAKPVLMDSSEEDIRKQLELAGFDPDWVQIISEWIESNKSSLNEARKTNNCGDDTDDQEAC